MMDSREFEQRANRKILLYLINMILCDQKGNFEND